MRFVSFILQSSHQICWAFPLLVYLIATVIYYNFISFLRRRGNILSKNISVCSLIHHKECLTDLFMLILFLTSSLNLFFLCFTICLLFARSCDQVNNRSCTPKILPPPLSLLIGHLPSQKTELSAKVALKTRGSSVAASYSCFLICFLSPPRPQSTERSGLIALLECVECRTCVIKVHHFIFCILSIHYNSAAKIGRLSSSKIQRI